MYRMSAAVAKRTHRRAFSTMNRLGINDVALAGKRVLMRVDFNVPFANVRRRCFHCCSRWLCADPVCDCCAHRVPSATRSASMLRCQQSSTPWSKVQRCDGLLVATLRVRPAHCVCSLPRVSQSVVLMSHLGRPNGQRKASLSLKPVAECLSEKIGRCVTFMDDCVGKEVEETCATASEGQVILLENLRFHAAEEGKIKKADGTKVGSPVRVCLVRREQTW